jgi:hypothetical protein
MNEEAREKTSALVQTPAGLAILLGSCGPSRKGVRFGAFWCTLTAAASRGTPPGTYRTRYPVRLTAFHAMAPLVQYSCRRGLWPVRHRHAIDRSIKRTARRRSYLGVNVRLTLPEGA